MKLTAILIFLGISLSSFGQNDYMMAWTKVGLRGDVIKKMDWMFNVSTRFDNQGVATFFPQAGIEYKVKKWFKPSVEYRFLVDRNKYGNYKSSHRINLNAGFKYTVVKRLALGARIRYQYAFKQLGATQDYDADFDQAFRFKPSVTYDIKGSIFSPTMTTEFFYNPELGENGRQFTKLRFAVGTKIELDGPHAFSVKYQFDKKLRNYAAGVRHVIALSYEFKL
jgi:hypothetical protein